MICLQLLFLIITFIVQARATDEIEAYETLIEDYVSAGLNFTFPEDASEYRPKTNTTQFLDTYDFIIIGLGSAGAVLANRLSQNSQWKILALEAGTFGNNITDIPNMGFVSRTSQFNWGYRSVPQKNACLDMTNQQCQFPRGKGVGGSSLINGLIYCRGSRFDYDLWSRIAGNERWSYARVLPVFKFSENYNHNDPSAPVDYFYHGFRGNLHVEYHRPSLTPVDHFVKANQESGFRKNDYNGRSAFGASPTQTNINHGRRDDTGNAFVKPILNRKNLHILTQSYVTNLVITNKIVTGVEFSHQGQLFIANASKEVILSAGAIGSPQILLQSGIGPKEHLEEVGVPLVKDLPVGSTLIDHPEFYGFGVSTNGSIPSQNFTQYIQEYFRGIGSLTDHFNLDGLGFYESKIQKNPNVPGIEFLFVPAYGIFSQLQKQFRNAKEKMWNTLAGGTGFNLGIINLHPKSRGTVRLKDNDRYKYPLINLNFLSDKNNEDAQVILEGIGIALELLKSDAFKSINATVQQQFTEACQNEEFLTDGYWYCVIKQFTSTVYHPVATCAMGQDPSKGAVVDSEGKVFGIERLRVADGSIIPVSLSGHTHAACVMIGEVISGLLKLRYL